MPVIDPISMAAFNFKRYGANNDLTVNREKTKVEDTSTINFKDQEGTSLAEHTQYVLDQGNQTTLGGSEIGGADEGPRAKAANGSLPWELYWTTDNAGRKATAPIIRNTQAYGTMMMGEEDSDDIDIDKREEGARLEEQQHKATRYYNRDETLHCDHFLGNWIGQLTMQNQRRRHQSSEMHKHMEQE